MKEKKLEELTINELKELAESDGIKVTTTKKADIIEEINKDREVDTTDSAENNQANTSDKSDEMSDEDNANDDNGSNDEVDTDDADKEMVEKNVDKDNKKSTDEVNKEIRKDVEIPKGFVKKSSLNKKEYGYYKGRKYKKMKNGYGMWADNGQSFLLSELK